MIQNRLWWLWDLTFLYFGALQNMSMIKITICSFLTCFIFLLLYFHRCLSLQIVLMRCYKFIVTCSMCRIVRKLEIISHVFKQKRLENEATITRACGDVKQRLYYFSVDKIKWNPTAIVTLIVTIHNSDNLVFWYLFVIFNPWKVPWNWIAFYQNSFVISPGCYISWLDATLDELQTRPLRQILLSLWNNSLTV